MTDMVGAGDCPNSPRLRVVAVVMDRRTGRPVNCNSSLHADGTDYTDVSAVEFISEVGAVYHCEWYTLQGVRIAAPTKGMGAVIRVEIRKDESRNPVKVLL